MRGRDLRARGLSLAGAVFAALLACSCCLGPLLLVGLGVGSAAGIAAIGAYRPYLLAATATLLLVAFYLTYRRPRASASDACGCEQPRTRRLGRIALWFTTVLVVAMAVSPPLLARWSDGGDTGENDPRLAHTTIRVEGIDCEACAGPMRKALKKVGGFRGLRLDVPSRRVIVVHEPSPGRVEAYVDALSDLGYDAALAQTGVRP